VQSTNLADDYSLRGMWKLPVEKARSLFVHREKFRKYQAPQNTVKQNAEALPLKNIALLSQCR
jgi:hypothetical protein